MITPHQMKAGRAMLDWRQEDLAEAAGLAEISIKNIERGATQPRPRTEERLRAAFEKAGLVLLCPADLAGGGRASGYGVQMIEAPSCGACYSLLAAMSPKATLVPAFRISLPDLAGPDIVGLEGGEG